MAFDDYVLGKIDRERQRKTRETPKDPILEKAHTRAISILNNPDFSIQEKEFVDLYGHENVMDDVRRVKEKKKSFETTETKYSAEAKKASDVFEAIVLEHAELSNWLGNDVSVLKTSTFDDYFNGTDMVAEWKEAGRESNVLALGVDVTFGVRSIEEKLMRIRRDIDKGHLGSIRYFKNEDGSFRGERKNVPHVVIGVSKQTVQHLADLWVKNDKRALGSHPVQRAMIEEMYKQLKTIQEYSLSRGQTKVAEAYGRSLAIVEKVHLDKRTVPLAQLDHDKVYEEILGQTSTVFRA